jgi:hypothetical protein
VTDKGALQQPAAISGPSASTGPSPISSTCRSRLSNQLGTQMIEAEARRGEHISNPDSMDLYFQGRACQHKGLSAENLAQARTLFERALFLDPDNVEALTGVAMVDAHITQELMAGDRSDGIKTARDIPRRRQRPRQALHSIRPLRCDAFGMAPRPTIQCTWRSASERSKACANLGCRRDSGRLCRNI